MTFKIIPFKKKYFRDYQNFVGNLEITYGKNLDIHHIGSTSVSGLGGKGVIDILIGIKSWRELENIIKSLKKVGIKYCWPKTDGRIFLSNKKINSLEGDFHIHIARKETEPYKNFLRFRNILRQDNSMIKEYKKVKFQALKRSGGSRFYYKHLKGFFVEATLKFS